MESQSNTEIPGTNKQTKLVDIPVTNQNEALNLMVMFLHLAQKRSCFTLDEAAKIYDCIKFFQS